MKLRKVKPDVIKVPEVRVTARFDDETWEQFQASIKEIGTVAPIICCLVEEELVLVDGLHRLIEARNNGALAVDVAVFEGDMIDVMTKNLFLDKMSGKPPVSEMVNVIGILWKEYGLDSEKIAARTGMSRDYVEKLQLISELTPLCLDALDQERIGVGHAAALTKIKDPVRQETVLHQQELYRWKVKELEDYIKEVLQLVAAKVEKKAEAEARPPVLIQCYFCRRALEVTQIANPNTCIECTGIMLASLAQARAEVESVQEDKKEEDKTQ